MKSKLALLLVVALSLYSLPLRANETNVTAQLTKEGRDARKAQAIDRFDLDRNGRLDQAERNLMRTELKSKVDPVRKRIIVPKDAAPSPRSP